MKKETTIAKTITADQISESAMAVARTIAMYKPPRLKDLMLIKDLNAMLDIHLKQRR